MSLKPKRLRGAAVLMVVLLVLLAGCSSPGGDSPGTETETPPMESPETTTADNGTADGERTSAMSGRLGVTIEGQDTHLGDAGDADASFWINESEEHTWHAANESMTMADALQQLGINASAESLTYDGTTYNDSENGTTVAYRVDGSIVEDPSEYQIEADDELFVYAGNGNQTTPGKYFSDDHPHAHGTLNVTVEGEQANFTDEKYVKADRFFHYHGNENGERWHAHAMNITVAYAISTFPDMKLTDESFTYQGEYYRGDNFGTTLNVTVNGEQVDPESYILKDGDDIKVEVTK